ncbi:MAG: RNA methyltransferase [Actinomycetota bacterium]|nr:RNA methyltransferase [Actinomycetota bacterium]
MSARPGTGGHALGLRHKRVQRVRRLLSQASYRRAEGAFVLEGAKLLEEALRAAAPLEAVYVAPHADPALDALVGQAFDVGVRVFSLRPGVMERVADTVTPQPILAIAGFTSRSLEEVRDQELLVVCVDVRDPGNLGTILRTAEAAGIGAVLCTDGTVDVYNPKCVRASAGSVFHVRLVAGGKPVEVLEQLGAWGVRRLGAAASGGTAYDEVDFRQPTAIVLGNEATGLPTEVTRNLDGLVSVRMVGRAESLNVGMAAAVLCFEAARQRRT